MNNADNTIASASENFSNTTTATKRRADDAKTKASETPTVFLTFTDPSEFLSKRTRLTVRSHVTARQHREARSKGYRGSKKFINRTPVQGAAGSQAEAERRVSSAGTEAPVESIRSAPTRDFRNDILPSSQESVDASGSIPDDGMNHASNQCTALLPPLRSGPSYSSTSSHDSGWTGLSNTSASTAATSTADSFEFETMLKSVEDYMHVVFSPLWWSSLGISEQYAVIWEECLAACSRQETALHYARLLFTSGHLLETGVVRPALCEMLKQKTTAAIHESLMSDRRDSNGLILAIGRLAFYESMYGSEPQIAHTLHRPAQSRIIQARGGLDCLDLPEVVKAAMRWEDAVMTLQAQGEPFLASGYDVSACNDAQALHTLRLWVPQQYAALLRRDSNARPIHALEEPSDVLEPPGGYGRHDDLSGMGR